MPPLSSSGNAMGRRIVGLRTPVRVKDLNYWRELSPALLRPPAAIEQGLRVGPHLHLHGRVSCVREASYTRLVEVKFRTPSVPQELGTPLS